MPGLARSSSSPSNEVLAGLVERGHLSQRRERGFSVLRVKARGQRELITMVGHAAMTIHKSQGSEYPAAVIPITTQHYTMLQRNLLYTGVTRGKRLVVLLGQRKALAIAVKRAQEGRRWSKLAEWLR
jgi:exodeoxyribonuclease V alpha subunit